MPNPGQPTISPGATGEAVRRLQRALRRTPNLGLVVDGVFGPATETAVKEFQQGAGLVVDGIVGPQTWAALPNGAPMHNSSVRAQLVPWSLASSRFSPTAHPANGTRRPGQSTEISGLPPRPRSRPFRLGAVSRPMELSAIKRGRFRCTRRARHWKALSVYNMPSDTCLRRPTRDGDPCRLQ